MKKRMLCAVLAPMLMFAMAVPGTAAGEKDSADRLAAVTGKVKDTLQLDTGRYQDFNGRLTEGELTPVWQLSWSGEGGSLEITAAESGKIISYSCYSEDEDRDSAPLSLPKSDPDRAKAAAAAFLGRVLDSYETVDLDAAADSGVSLRQTRYYFRGSILLHGCPSPLYFSLAVRAFDYEVVQFRRDGLETGYIGGLPTAGFRMQQDAAQPLLQSTLSMRLEYVLDEGGTRAVLRYLPNRTHSFYVDDASGELIDLTKLYEELGESDQKASAAGAAAQSAMDTYRDEGNGGLTQAEQLGADKLKGTLGKERLDQTARSIAPLGLDSYTLASAAYREEELVKDAPVIVARLTYAKRVDDRTFRRMVTLDAKTGALIEVSSSGLWDQGDSRQVSQESARQTAQAFLSAQQGERFALCAPYAGDPAWEWEDGGTWRFQYARQERGYFFPDQQFTVEIDAADGSVFRYAQSWPEGVSFDSPDGIVSMDQAVAAYFNTFQITRGYVAVPQKLDLSVPEYEPLVKLGYRALNSLKPGWQLTAPEQMAVGVDAKTGRPVLQDIGSSSPVQYSDLAGSRAKTAAETLARYGIGYAGGALRPNKGLTQLDLAALLASTQGAPVDPDNLAAGEADRVYRTIYGMGVLRREARNDNQLLTRMDVIKFLLDAGGYGPAARLQGIYRTDFADEAEIPGELLGYAALAQALNVAQGDSAGRLNPDRPATREDAVVMLFALMQRS